MSNNNLGDRDQRKALAKALINLYPRISTIRTGGMDPIDSNILDYLKDGLLPVTHENHILVAYLCLAPGERKGDLKAIGEAVMHDLWTGVVPLLIHPEANSLYTENLMKMADMLAGDMSIVRFIPGTMDMNFMASMITGVVAADMANVLMAMSASHAELCHSDDDTFSLDYEEDSDQEEIEKTLSQIMDFIKNGDA